MTATLASFNSLTTLDAALTYANMGIAVFPVYTAVATDGKGKVTKPVPEDGLLSATTDINQITQWWTQHPRAGIGVIPGSYPGFLIVDADNQQAREFIESILGAPTVLTPSTDGDGHGGGGHWWVFGLDPNMVHDLHIDAAHRVKVADKSLAVELIGAGSGSAFTYAPPTVRNGRPLPYRMVNAPITASHVPQFVSWLETLRVIEVREREARKRRAEERELFGDGDNENLNDWMRSTSWDSLLTRDKWTDTGIASCGCPQYVHPFGATVTSRSAIAHYEHCDRSMSSFPGGGLKVFSHTARVELGGDTMLSKFGYVTNMRYFGNFEDARKGEGIESEDGFFDSGSSFDPNDFI